jgi:hypothetical protein
MVQVGSHTYRRVLQIWQNLPLDHHHFGYITKLTKDTASNMFPTHSTMIHFIVMGLVKTLLIGFFFGLCLLVLLPTVG